MNYSCLAKLIAAKNSPFKLQPDHKLVFRAEWDLPEARLAGVRDLVRQLAEMAGRASAQTAR